MTNQQLDYTGKINAFLMAKKEYGLSPQKVPLYLNLLKFLASHFSEKGSIIEEIAKPADEIMQIKFEGIDPEVQQEYLQLFLDFIGFCKKTAQGTDPSHAVRRDEKDHMAEHAVDEIKCPKCGFEQNKSPRCVQCGTPLMVVVKRIQYEPGIGSARSKKSTRYLAFVLIAIFVIALLYQFLGNGGNEKIKDYKLEVSIKVIDLDSYVDSIRQYVKELKSVEEDFSKLNTGAVSWESEHEKLLAGVVFILDVVRKIRPPVELKGLHAVLINKNSAVLSALDEAKGNLNSQKTTGSRLQRTGRAFSGVKETMQDLTRTKNKFVATINFICKYNDAGCRL